VQRLGSLSQAAEIPNLRIENLGSARQISGSCAQNVGREYVFREILLMDSCSVHFDEAANDYLRDNGVKVGIYPPNTTHFYRFLIMLSSLVKCKPRKVLYWQICDAGPLLIT